MGNWNLSIHGVGVHHNKKLSTDANRMLANFVKDLQNAGHTISRATITYGAEDDVTDPAKYIGDRDVIESETK